MPHWRFQKGAGWVSELGSHFGASAFGFAFRPELNPNGKPQNGRSHVDLNPSKKLQLPHASKPQGLNQTNWPKFNAAAAAATRHDASHAPPSCRPLSWFHQHPNESITARAAQRVDHSLQDLPGFQAALSPDSKPHRHLTSLPCGIMGSGSGLTLLGLRVV